MIDEIIFNIHFKIHKCYLERWCQDYGYKNIEDFKIKGNDEVAYMIYCNSYFQRSW